MTRPLKRSFAIAGHKTSISLEAAFWDALKEAAAAERVPLARLVERIDRSRADAGLSSAVRVWILDYVRGKYSLLAEPSAAADAPATRKPVTDRA